MEQLNNLIKDASNEFQCHNFQTALQLYMRCIRKCQEQKFPTYILHNLKSSEAALRAILGQEQASIAILNGVLSQNQQHWLSLVRRSQIYKKQKKYKKALRDLQVLSMYAPDNMHVAALKLGIKSLKNKNDESFSETQSNQEDQQIDEDRVLNFSNLRKIDRTSVSIMVPKGRQSRVSMGGDKAFFYQEQKQERDPRQSIALTPHYIRKRFIQIEDELDQKEEPQKLEELKISIKSAPCQKKSILRNRGSKIYLDDHPSKLNSQGLKLVQKLKNIQGHIINSEQGSLKGSSLKQVQFRKNSIHQEPQKIEKFLAIKKKPTGRKSCLKRSSFSGIPQQGPKNQRRSSKFQQISTSSIDGKMIKSDKKRKNQNSEAEKQNRNVNQSGDQSEEGSQYNIFGSQKLDIVKQLRQNLGLGSDQIVEVQRDPKNKKRGESILKKTSILVKKQGCKPNKTSIFFKDFSEQKKQQKKAKKSVMFRSC